jgi:cell wall-associated NlpC family hydrolase
LCTVTISSRPASAKTSAAQVSADRAKAAALLAQINAATDKVDKLGQVYDQTQMKLNRINNEIDNTRAAVAAIKAKISTGNSELEADAIFAYVTNGSAQSSNPLFTTNAGDLGATNVYNNLAQGNVSTTIAGLKNYSLELTQERAVLNGEEAQAADANAIAQKAFNSAQGLQNALNADLRQVKGQIAVYVAEQQRAAEMKDAGTLKNAKPIAGFPAPPPDSVANIAVRAALSYVGVWYRWGGASRSGVDCSGLVMLAYEAAGIDLSHYSGAQWDETTRVPLYDIEPGDLLFYGYDGDEHVAMYVGHGDMVEAEMTGTRVHVVPIRLGYGFAGLGRPRG